MYIDLNTLKPAKEIFEIDDEIYPVLSTLWEKGYKTKSSCAGHNEIDCIESFENGKIIKNYIFRNQTIQVYILFDDVYDFNSRAEGFKITNINCYEIHDDTYKTTNKTSISCLVCVHTESMVEVSSKSLNFECVDEKLLEARNKLLEWAISLPYLEKENERKRK